jgi:hypothetical protein
MSLTKEEKLFLYLRKSFLNEMTEEELENFCDIPSADIEYSLNYFGENIQLSNIHNTTFNYTLLKLYFEFKRINDLINNIYYSEEDKINKYKVKLLPLIILADHFRKELTNELKKKFYNKHKINKLLNNINELYNLLQDYSLKLGIQQNSYKVINNIKPNNELYVRKKEYLLKAN